MDDLQPTNTNEGARISRKRTSRRKKSRPVKFNQDLDETEVGNEFDNNAANFSHDNPSGDELHSYGQSPAAGDEQTEDFMYGLEDSSPASSSGMIQRRVTSIRDASLKTGNPKRIKLEESSSPELEVDYTSPAELDTQNASHQEQETTFSSLLHNFASQVHTKIEQPDRQSPYPSRPPNSETIWSMQNVNPSVVASPKPRLQSEKVNQQQMVTDKPTLDLQKDVSFSGLLQNFVSCVNDTPPKQVSTSKQSLLSLLKRGQPTSSSQSTPDKSVSERVLYTSNQHPPAKEEQKSFAGLLHSFASDVDKRSQGPSNATGHDGVKNLQNHGLRKQPQGTAGISLLDVLHDTISRQILQSAPPSSTDAPSPHLNPSQSTFGYSTADDTVLGRISNVRHEPPQSSSPENLITGNSQKIDQDDDLHPNGQQWSHIKNVLPPLDPTEEDTMQEQNYTPMLSHATETSRAESWSHQETYQSTSITPARRIKQEPIDEDSDCGQDGQNLSMEIKSEPLDYPASNTQEDNQNVASTLRERLLSRIESRHTLTPVSAVSSNTAASGQNANLEAGRDHLHENKSSDDVRSHEIENKMTNQGGLVSHLLTSADSSHWKNRHGGSFADLLHNITSSMLEKEVKGSGSQSQDPEQQVIKQEPGLSEGKPTSPAPNYSLTTGEDFSSSSVSALIEAKESGISEKKKIPRCIARLLGQPTYSTQEHTPGTHEVRAQRMKVVSYADVSSAPSSPSTGSEEAEPTLEDPRILNSSYHSLSPRSKSVLVMKQRIKRSQNALKQKKELPKRKRLEVRSLQEIDPGVVERDLDLIQVSQPRTTNSNTSFTDILQKLAQKCQAGNQGSQLGGSSQQQSPNTLASVMQKRPERYILPTQPSASKEVHSPTILSRLSTPVSSASLKNLPLKPESSNQLRDDAECNSGNPSSSVQSRDVSFSNLMQNMASTVTKKKTRTTQSPFEDLTTLGAPSPWIKSTSGNWLRFIIISPDENPRATISVSVNLWNSIHEVKIHCHHLEVPVNHWIFRRFGKRIHTKAGLAGVLQAISNGCSVCEGTTRSDLVQMFRNKLASTSRWQAAAVLEDSFGSSAVRSRQCELLVSGLRRSREKRCSKCSKFVDRKLKAVMYHMRKKLGLS